MSDASDESTPSAAPGETVTLVAAVQFGLPGDVVLFQIAAPDGQSIDALKGELVDGAARAPWTVTLGSLEPPLELAFKASCLGSVAASGALRVVPPDLRAGGGWFLAETSDGAPEVTFEEVGAEPFSAAPAWLPNGRVLDGTALFLRCELASGARPVQGTVEATFTIERAPAPGGTGATAPVETITATTTSAAGVRAVLLRWVARLPGAAPATARVTLRWKKGTTEGGAVEAPALVVERASPPVDKAVSRVHLALRGATGAAPLAGVAWTLKLAVGSSSGVTDADGVLSVSPVAPGDYDLEVTLAPGRVVKLRVPSGRHSGPRPTIVPGALVVPPGPTPAGQEPLQLSLVDAEDDAVGGEPWVVGLPDGQVVTGALDPKGRAAIASTAGTCLVVFRGIAGTVVPPSQISGHPLADLVAPAGPWPEARLKQELGADALGQTGYLVPTGALQAFHVPGLVTEFVIEPRTPAVKVEGVPFTVTMPDGEQRKGTVGPDRRVRVVVSSAADKAKDKVKLRLDLPAGHRIVGGEVAQPAHTTFAGADAWGDDREPRA